MNEEDYELVNRTNIARSIIVEEEQETMNNDEWEQMKYKKNGTIAMHKQEE